ncbi:MAG TPA: glutaminyl-peptide cyclotransferase [Niastella sp.]|nr:glutaminyl-peptide cyclotransferase [Niastella sp.]
MKSFLLPVLFFLFVGAGCSNNDTEATTPSATEPKTPVLSYTVTATYPHDTSSYTQGLEFLNGQLFEGTGNYGFSKLLQVDLKTGKSAKQLSLAPKLFGEGITILHDTLYQLTWKEKTVFAYEPKTFKKLTEYPLNTEGWGLTNDGKNLIATDGSSNLYFYEPSTFRLLRTQGVTEVGSPAFNLNELEYINGFIYANQYEYNYILKIDPSSGHVVAKLDLSELVNRLRSKDPQIRELNGIAYDSTTKKIYITGKWWPELYEVQFEH